MHGFHDLPVFCVPANWTPLIDELLSDIWSLLTPEQRAAFVVEDVKEKWGRLRIDWSVGAEVSSDVLDRIDALISEAFDDFQSNAAR